MERVKLTFCSSEKSGVDHELMTHCNSNDEIYIEIRDPENVYDPPMFVALDRPTAIRLVKHLKKEISYIGTQINAV